MADRKCEVIDNLDIYKTKSSEDFDEKFHIESVVKAMGTDRKYYRIFGDMYDSHNEIEKLGVCKHCRKYTTIISLEDSLDYILHRLSGCSTDKIRQLSDYDRVSRALMKLNFDALEGIHFGDLRMLDDKMAAFLDKILLEVGTNSDEEDISAEFVERFASTLFSELKRVLEYVVFNYLFSLNKGVAVLRSKSLCSFVLSSYERLETDIIIKSEGYEDYSIKVRSFEKWQYLEDFKLKYA
jgi:hypothetical protein